MEDVESADEFRGFKNFYEDEIKKFEAIKVKLA